MTSLIGRSVLSHGGGESLKKKLLEDLKNLDISNNQKKTLRELSDIYLKAEQIDNKKRGRLTINREKRCEWIMGCSCIPHPVQRPWQEIEVLDELSMLAKNSNPITSSLREFVSIEKDHKWPTSKWYDSGANTEGIWLCQRHNQHWKTNLLSFGLHDRVHRLL